MIEFKQLIEQKKKVCSVENLVQQYQFIKGFDDGSSTFINSTHHQGNFQQGKKVTIITASGIEKSPLIVVDKISVLGKEARNVECVVHDLPEQSRVDGLLGLSFLRRFKICIDFKNGLLEIV